MSFLSSLDTHISRKGVDNFENQHNKEPLKFPYTGKRYSKNHYAVLEQMFQILRQRILVGG